MIYVLHGDNLISSRDFILTTLKKSGSKAKVEIDLDSVSPEYLYQQCISFDIFGDPPFVVLDISGSKKKIADFSEVLGKVPSETTLIIFSSKSLAKNSYLIKNSTKLGIRVVSNKLSPKSNMFNFVDSVFFGRREASYKELRKLILDNTEPFYMFSMLLYGLRNITLDKFKSPNFHKLPPFVKGKVQRQSLNFSEDGIKELYNDFYSHDKKVKTGELDVELLIPLSIEKVFEKVVK